MQKKKKLEIMVFQQQINFLYRFSPAKFLHTM